ncbi:MAG: hypothetical protein JWM76_4422 [Pseudonocardiales bacterium]|nr:hypothetical protein [Pseudonocardiales bacterium]
MTASHGDTTPRPAHRVGDQVLVDQRGDLRPGRISSVHHHDGGIEYVVRADARDGGMGGVVNVWTTSGHSSYLVPLTLPGDQR